jgi:hypothetical protein
MEIESRRSRFRNPGQIHRVFRCDPYRTLMLEKLRSGMLRGWHGRDWVNRLGDSAILWRLFKATAFVGWQAFYVPVCQVKGFDVKAKLRGEVEGSTLKEWLRKSGKSAWIAIRSHALRSKWRDWDTKGRNVSCWRVVSSQLPHSRWCLGIGFPDEKAQFPLTAAFLSGIIA